MKYDSITAWNYDESQHGSLCSLPWKWWIWKTARMFALLIFFFFFSRRIEGVYLVTKTCFLYKVGEQERKESCKCLGWLLLPFSAGQGLNHWVMGPTQWPWLVKPHAAAPWADSHPFLVSGALGHGTVVPLVLGLVCSELWPQSLAFALARWVLCAVCPSPWAEVSVPLGHVLVMERSWVSSSTTTRTQIAFYTA